MKIIHQNNFKDIKFIPENKFEYFQLGQLSTNFEDLCISMSYDDIKKESIFNSITIKTKDLIKVLLISRRI